MKRFYLFPDRRSTYRIIKIHHYLFKYALQQRERWLWFERWRDITQGNYLNLLQERKAHLESLETQTEQERVVDVTR